MGHLKTWVFHGAREPSISKQSKKHAAYRCVLLLGVALVVGFVEGIFKN
jgi:hypothetical protein